MFSKLSLFTLFLALASRKSLLLLQTTRRLTGLLAVFIMSSAVPLAEVQVEERGCGRWACMDVLTVSCICIEIFPVV